MKNMIINKQLLDKQIGMISVLIHTDKSDVTLLEGVFELLCNIDELDDNEEVRISWSKEKEDI